MTHKMQTHVAGRGRPIALVGGGLTGWKSWEPHQERLATSRRVARVQPLSVQFGLENRPLPAGYSVDLESGALAAALADLSREPIDLVAWSYGAAIGLDFALEHPDRVRTLTLIEPPALWILDATGGASDESRREVERLRALHASMTDDVSEEQLASFVVAAGLVPSGQRPQDLPAWPTWVEHRRSLRIGDALWMKRDSLERLRGFDHPVLLVTGAGTSSFLREITDRLAAALPRAELLELPGGHAPQIVAMDAFLARLAEHTAEAGSTRSAR